MWTHGEVSYLRKTMPITQQYALLTSGLLAHLSSFPSFLFSLSLPPSLFLFFPSFSLSSLFLSLSLLSLSFFFPPSLLLFPSSFFLLPPSPLNDHFAQTNIFE